MQVSAAVHTEAVNSRLKYHLSILEMSAGEKREHRGGGDGI